jgi:hypothetical protein
MSRRIVESYGSAEGLHVVISGVTDASSFNRLSCADRVRAAGELLESEGARALNWREPARAMDAAVAALPAGTPQGHRDLLRLYGARPITTDAAPARNTRATRLHRALDVVMDRMEARGRRRPARDSNREPRRDDWGRVPAEDSTLPLRDHAEQTFLAGQREMGVREPYGERAFAYRPARAADAGEWSDMRWMEESAAASCGWGR